MHDYRIRPPTRTASDSSAQQPCAAHSATRWGFCTALAAGLLLLTPVPSQSRGFVCHKVNSGFAAIPNRTLRNEWIVEVIAPCNQLVVGFEVLHAPLVGPTSITASLYLADAAGMPEIRAARSKQVNYFQSGTSPWMFSSPIWVARGQKYFVGFDYGEADFAVPWTDDTRAVNTQDWTRLAANEKFSRNMFLNRWLYSIECFPGSYEAFGSQCGGPKTQPIMSFSGNKFVGGAVSFRVDTVNQADATLMVGASRTQWGSIPLPFELGLLNAPGCYLYCSLDAWQPIGKERTLVVTIPDDPSLIGQTVYAQWLVTNHGGNRALLTSRAVAVRIGHSLRQPCGT
ncbi:MAG: hypothetical protein H6837_03685 [Planctomycetes bacterium]|nr:hypothetical protein [Planctomycetota bacterium]